MKMMNISVLSRLLLGILSVVLFVLNCNGAVVAATVTNTDQQEQFESGSESDLKTTLTIKERLDLLKHHPDAVLTIPGYNQPLPSPWMSGYLSYEFYNRTIHTHYTFVQAEDNELGTKPILYWSNGGPGASSLFGLLTELGPLLLSDISLTTDDYRNSGIPTPIYNVNSWSKIGHILVFDQPAPIGFSYCNNNMSSHSCNDLSWNDELTAQNAFAALQAFYAKFSCIQSLDLYLTGESYAGIYIPTFAKQIIQYNTNITTKKVDSSTNEEVEEEQQQFEILLKGFAVGDGCLGTETETCYGLHPQQPDGIDKWLLLFLAGHHQIPLETLTYVMKACADDINKDHTLVDDDMHNRGHTSMIDMINKLTTTLRRRRQLRSAVNENYNTEEDIDETCQAALQLVTDQVGGYYEYGVYDDCTYTNGLLRTYISTINTTTGVVHDDNEINTERVVFTNPVKNTINNNNNIVNNNNNNLYSGVNDYPCGGDIVMEQYYLNLQTVQETFHLQSTFFSVDNAELDFDYTPSEKDLSKTFYKQLIDTNIANAITNTTTAPIIKVLIYNGDADPAITSFAAHDWTSRLGYETIEGWRPWTVDGCRRVGGYVTRYDGNFDFLTIRGAGHMVPTHKSAAAFAFLKSWVNGEEYPLYDKNCTLPKMD